MEGEKAELRGQIDKLKQKLQLLVTKTKQLQAEHAVDRETRETRILEQERMQAELSEALAASTKEQERLQAELSEALAASTKEQERLQAELSKALAASAKEQEILQAAHSEALAAARKEQERLQVELMQQPSRSSESSSVRQEDYGKLEEDFHRLQG